MEKVSTVALDIAKQVFQVMESMPPEQQCFVESCVLLPVRMITPGVGVLVELTTPDHVIPEGNQQHTDQRHDHRRFKAADVACNALLKP
jgi:hypothetical protein